MATMYVDIDLSDIDDDELVEELEDRGYRIVENGLEEESSLITEIYLLRRLGRPYDHLVDKLIYEAIGKVI
jgi:hypothetical protein